MLNRLRRTIREKGQGLTEYVLIIAFIAGIAFMMFGGNGSLRGTLVNTIIETNSKLAGMFDGGNKYVTAFKEWSKKTREELSDIPDKDLIAADQEALANIGKYFMEQDLTKAQLATLLGVKKSELTDLKQGILLVNYHDNAADIDTDFHQERTTISPAQVFEWMQGDYDSNGSATLNSETRYFFSDNITTVLNEGNQYENDRSIRLSFKFDGNGDNAKVEAVRVRVNRGNTKGDMSSTPYYRELDVTVNKNGSWKQTIDGAPGAITKQESWSYNY